MYSVIWNMNRIKISETERDHLLAEGLIYDPETPEYPMYGAYYPEDDVDMGIIEEVISDLRKK